MKIFTSVKTWISACKLNQSNNKSIQRSSVCLPAAISLKKTSFNILKNISISVSLSTLFLFSQNAHADGIYMTNMTSHLTEDSINQLTDSSHTAGAVAGDIVEFVLSAEVYGKGKSAELPADDPESGPGVYFTAYIPNGVEVLDAAFVDDISGATTKEPAQGGLAADGWVKVELPFKTPYTSIANGRMNDIYGDTGIFYSTDPDTKLQLEAGDTSNIAIGPTIEPDGTAGISNGILVDVTAWGEVDAFNQWDKVQADAFGSAGGFVTDGRGVTPFEYGSTVAGPDTGYKYEYNGSILNSEGPWKRIKYLGSTKADISDGAAVDCAMGINPCGYKPGSDAAGIAAFTPYVEIDASTTGALFPLPTTTNAVRWANGYGKARTKVFVKIKARITATALAATDGVILNFTANGSDSIPGGSKDNHWRYFAPTTASTAEFFFEKKILKVNDANYFSGPIAAGSKITYQIRYLNVGNLPTNNFTLTDDLPLGIEVTACDASSPTLSNFSDGVTATVSAGDGDCPAAGAKLTFGNLPNVNSNRLDALRGGTFTFDVKIEDSLVNGVVIKNDATLEADDAGTDVTVIKTDFASVVIGVPLNNIVINDVTKVEGQPVNSATTSFDFQVSMSMTETTPTTITYTVNNGSATLLSGDYSEPPIFSVVIPADSLTGTISIPVNTDTDIELDETFSVTLITTNNGTIADDIGLGTIINDDFPVGSVSGSVLDPAGNPVVGASVSIKDLTGNVINDTNGNALTTTVDAGNGSYNFINVPIGEYEIVETNPANYVSTTDVDSSDDTDTSPNTNTNDDKIPLTLTTDELDADNNFVDAAVGSVSGTVKDPAGAVVVGAKVKLVNLDGTAAKDSSGIDIAEVTVTPATGAYSFSNVPIGEYEIIETNPTNYGSISDADSTDDGDTANNTNINDDKLPLTLTVGEIDANNDFVDSAIGSVSGSVLDTDGTVVVGASVSIQTLVGAVVKDTNGDFLTAIVNSTTGAYSFSNVPVGEYEIVETNPANYISTLDGDTSADTDTTTNTNTNDDKIPLTVTVGKNDANNNFVDDAIGAVSGSVKDPSGNVVVGAKVKLVNLDDTPATNSLGVAIAEVTVDSVTGAYSFSNVPVGDYKIVETNPTNYVSTSESSNQTGDPANSSLVDDEIPVTVTLGESDTNNDFVDVTVGSVSGSVLDSGDNPVVGASVSIQTIASAVVKDTNGDFLTVIVNSTTGAYSFSNVPVGEYEIVETNPANYVSILDGDTSADADTTDNTNTNDDKIPLTVTVGKNDASNDFVDDAIGAVSGSVKDPAGNVVVGAKVKLVNLDDTPATNSLGVAIAEVTVDSVTGAYSFSNVPVGDYKIVETNPANYVSTSESSDQTDDPANSSLVDDEIPATVTIGESDTDNDFVDSPLGVVAGTVYEDTNGNGQQDPGEPGIPNVTVTATDLNLVDYILTTDANGNYATQIPAGAGVIDVDESTLPGGFVRTQGTEPTAVVVPIGGIANDIDGYQPPADAGKVTGVVYEDTNGNGIQETLELGIPGVTVIITDTNGIAQTRTTDINGAYSATVLAGVTTVDIDETTVPGDSVQTGGTDLTMVTVPAGGTATDEDGYQPSVDAGTVSGVIYEDTDGLGSQDSGELGLSGVQVKITDSAGNTQTVTTDATGNYSATVPPGITIIDIVDSTLPGGSTQTEGSDTTTVTVPVGGSLIDVDGYQPASNNGTLNGVVYEDSNGSNSRDPSEPGIPGVTVTVTDIAGNIQTLVTDANGAYSTTVLAGETLVDIDQSDVNPAFLQTEGADPSKVIVPLNGIGSDVDGFKPGGVVAGTVYEDTNGNNEQDPGEPGIANVTVTVTDITGTNNVLISDVNGNYAKQVPVGFTDIEIDVSTLPGGFVQTEGNNPTTVEVVIGSIANDIDGYKPPADAGTITGIVYQDSNNNFTQDSGELGIPGVTVTVTDINNSIQTLTTDSNGAYSATVPAGNTTVEIDETTLPGGSVQTEGDNPTIVPVLAGEIASDVDGYLPPATAGSVTGLIYADTNGNGLQDGTEQGLPGVQVNIIDADGNIQTVTTNSTGNYSATVPAGTTVIDIVNSTLPGGSTQTQGNDSTTVIVPVNGAASDIDGYKPSVDSGTLNGVIFEDSNANGTQDMDEPGIPGVNVTVTDSAGGIQTLVTDANGLYSAIVPSGSTLVDIEQSDVDSRLTYTVGTDPTTLIVPAGGTASDIDGFAPSSINGVVFIDNIDNDSKDPEEAGLGGWIIELENDAGEIVTLQTAADGTFNQRLASGDYTVIIKSPGGLIVKEQQVTLTPGNPAFVPEPIDPSGVVYDETTGDAVPGATLTLLNAATGNALPAVCLGAGEQGQVTGATGGYAFFLNPGADPACPVGDTVYELRISAPAGFQPSIGNPPEVGALDAETCPGDAVPGAPCEVSAQTDAPIIGITPYYMQIDLAAGDQGVFNNHIPLRIAPENIPTLSEWALMMLMMLLGFVGYRQGLVRKI